MSTKKCKEKIDNLKDQKICIDKIKELVAGCPPAIINNKLENYSGQCLSQEEIALREKIAKIDTQTEKSELGAIKESAASFVGLIKEFEKQYANVKRKIEKSIKGIDVSIGITTLSILDKQAKIFGIGDNIATAEYNRKQQDVKKRVKAKINALNKDTTKEYRQALKKEAEDNGLTKVFKDKIDDIKKDINQEIANLDIGTEKTKISSIKISAINYDLGKEFSDKFNQVANQIKLNLENIKPDTLKKNIDSLNIQAANYDLGNNIATRKQVATKINALSKSAPKSERQGLEQKSRSNNLIKEFNNKVYGIKEEIKKDIKGLNADTKDSAILLVESSSSNYALKDNFDKRYNFIKNEIQTQINKINITTNPEVISTLNAQGKNYNLGKDAATTKFTQVQEVANKIAALDKKTSKADRKIVKEEAEQHNLVKEYADRVASIKTNIGIEISELKIDSNKTEMESVKRYADNYDLEQQYKEKYGELQKEVTIKINTFRIDASESSLESLRKSSVKFGLNAQFNKLALQMKICKTFKDLERTNKLESATELIDKLVKILSPENLNYLSIEEKDRTIEITKTVKAANNSILYRANPEEFKTYYTEQHACTIAHAQCKPECTEKQISNEKSLKNHKKSMEKFMKCIDDCADKEKIQICKMICTGNYKETLQIFFKYKQVSNCETYCNHNGTSCEYEIRDELKEIEKSSNYTQNLVTKLVNLFPAHIALNANFGIDLNNKLNTNKTAKACTHSQCQFKCQKQQNTIQNKVLTQTELISNLLECTNKETDRQDSCTADSLERYQIQESQLQYLYIDCDAHCAGEMTKCEENVVIN